MNKSKLSTLLSDYGMILVLFILGIVFTLSTFKEQPAEGKGAGQTLASLVEDQKEVILVVSKSNSDSLLQEAFSESLKDSDIKLHIVSARSPIEAKKALTELQKEVPVNTLLICSRQTGNWTFYNSIQHFADSKQITPSIESSSSFLSSGNLSSLPGKTAKTAIIAIGMTMVIITAGIDLSVGSLVALASVVSTLLLRDLFGGSGGVLNVTLAFAAAIGLCGLIGMLSGVLTTAFKIPSFIVTLAVMLIARGWAQNLSANQTIKVGVPDISWLGLGNGGVYTIALMVLLYAIAYMIMHKTVLGRQIYAIGGNQEAARLSGVPVNKVLIIVYTIAGIMAGIAGIVLTSELNSGSGEYGETWELSVIAAVVVGGTSLMGGQGKILGTLIGCAIIEVINNGMNLMGIGSNTQKIVLGLVILLAIIIDKMKKGEIAWISNISEKFKSKDKKENIQCLSESTVKAS